MEDITTFFKKDTSAIKNSKHMKRNVFVIYSPRHIKIEPENFRRTGYCLFTLEIKWFY